MEKPHLTVVIAIFRAISDPQKVRGGVAVRLQNDLLKLRLQAVALEKQGRSVRAILIVLTKEVRVKVAAWVTNLRLEKYVKILSVAGAQEKDETLGLTAKQVSSLKAEKERQARSNQISRPEQHCQATAKQAPKIAKEKARQILSHRYSKNHLVETKVEDIFIKATFVGVMSTLTGDASKPPKADGCS